MSYGGQIVTANNYNLFSKIERRNAQKELKAYLKGEPYFSNKVFVKDKDKEDGKWELQLAAVKHKKAEE